MKYKYYVVNVRFMKSEDFVNIFDFEEAIKRGWIDENGNRIWIVPANEEKSITSVYGFNDLNKAVEFYDALAHNGIGIKATEN